MINAFAVSMNIRFAIRTLARYFSIFILFFCFSSCESELPTIDLLVKGSDVPSETMKNAEIIYSDSGYVKMKITGNKLDRFAGEKPHIVFPDGVNMLFYDDSMKISSRLKADYGIRYEAEGGMEAKRNVEVINIKGEKLNTEHLIWDEEGGRIFTEVFVKITTGDEVIYGDGLESNQDFTKYRIKNIKGVFNLKDEGAEQEMESQKAESSGK